jgi:hypothetical protein
MRRAVAGSTLVSATSLVVVVLVVMAAGTVQSITGFGFALLAVPLLSFAIDARLAVVVSTTLSFAASSWLAAHEWSHCDRPTAKRMIIGAAIGSPFGLFVLHVASERALRLGLALMITAFLVVNLRGLRLHHAGPGTDLGVGVVSGVLSTSLSTNGPPLVMVLHARHLPPATFRATLGTVFAASGTIAVVLFAGSGFYDHDALVTLAVSAPAVLAGIVLGRRLAGVIAPGAFRRMVMWLLALTAAAAAVGALVG